jgi:hypothetical protein
MRLTRQRVIAIAAALDLGSSCAGLGRHPGVLSFSEADASAAIDGSGLPRGGPRTMRRNADRSAVLVEWITDAAVLLVELPLDVEHRPRTPSRRQRAPDGGRVLPIARAAWLHGKNLPDRNAPESCT